MSEQPGEVMLKRGPRYSVPALKTPDNHGPDKRLNRRGNNSFTLWLVHTVGSVPMRLANRPETRMLAVSRAA